MKISTATNHKNRLANRMRSIYASAVYDRPCHRDLVARVSETVWAFIGSDGVPRQLNDLPESDRQAVFSGAIQGGHYWLKSDRKTETLPDGRIVETITKTPTLSKY